MKNVLISFAIWAAFSYLVFRTLGAVYVIPYALGTMAVFALLVWLANKKKA